MSLKKIVVENAEDLGVEFLHVTDQQVYVTVFHPIYEDVAETSALDREQARRVRDFLTAFLENP